MTREREDSDYSTGETWLMTLRITSHLQAYPFLHVIFTLQEENSEHTPLFHKIL